jgi:hypothetical protein
MREKKIGKRKSQTRTWANSTLIGPPPRYLQAAHLPSRTRADRRARIAASTGARVKSIFSLAWRTQWSVAAPCISPARGPRWPVPVPSNFVPRMAAGRCTIIARPWLTKDYISPAYLRYRGQSLSFLHLPTSHACHQRKTLVVHWGGNCMGANGGAPRAVVLHRNGGGSCTP